MAESFKFALVSPERVLVSEDVEEVIVPGTEGEFTVLARHAPFISTLRPGILRIPGGKTRHTEIYVRGGLAEVNGESLTVLAERAVPLSEMNAALLEKEIEALQAEMEIAADEWTRIRTAEMLSQLRTLGENLNLAA